MINKPLILVVNDDGINAQGINFLAGLMREIGEVFVVAPSSNRSGTSHAMTLHEDIYVNTVSSSDNIFTCSGNPVDCVKLALNKILPRKPDLCVSGINHGSNHSINSLYSGTLHGAMEATIKGVSAISFSHLSYETKINFNEYSSFIKNMCKENIDNKLLQDITLNINIPDVPFSLIKGVKICRQGRGQWNEEFVATNKKDNMPSYRISGKFISQTHDKESDSWALDNNYISIVPVSIYPDHTSHLQSFKYLENVI